MAEKNLIATKPNVRRSAMKIKKARKIIKDIYSLAEDNSWELNKATDAMYKYIKEIER